MSPSHHWAIPPERDARTWLPPSSRGQLARGHTLGRCRACEEPPPPAAVVVARRAVTPPHLSVVPHEPAVRRAPPRCSAPVPKRPTRRPSLRESLLVTLASMGDVPVPLSVLVVRAWEREPRRFGLLGFEHLHPDANRVQAKLSGADGLCALGWCTRLSPGVLAVTPAGRLAAAALAKGGAP